MQPKVIVAVLYVRKLYIFRAFAKSNEYKKEKKGKEITSEKSDGNKKKRNEKKKEENIENEAEKKVHLNIVAEL